MRPLSHVSVSAVGPITDQRKHAASRCLSLLFIAAHIDAHLAQGDAGLNGLKKHTDMFIETITNNILAGHNLAADLDALCSLLGVQLVDTSKKGMA